MVNVLSETAVGNNDRHRISAGWENLPLVGGQLQQRKRSTIC